MRTRPIWHSYDNDYSHLLGIFSRDAAQMWIETDQNYLTAYWVLRITPIIINRHGIINPTKYTKTQETTQSRTTKEILKTL